MKKSFFPTNNYHNMIRAVEALKTRDASLPGLGLVYGRWGLGKSEAIDHYYGESNIYYVRALRTWGIRDLLRDGICEELKLHPEWRTVDCFKQVCKELRRRGEPLFIDEADYLFKSSAMLDVMRDLHDITRVPVILVGMEDICGRLQKFGQFWSRILPAGIVEFKPLSPPEMIVIAREWCELDLSPEGAEILCRFTEGDFRFIVGYLLELERACEVNKIKSISEQMANALLAKLSKKKELAERFSTNIKKLRVTGRE